MLWSNHENSQRIRDEAWRLLDGASFASGLVGSQRASLVCGILTLLRLCRLLILSARSKRQHRSNKIMSSKKSPYEALGIDTKASKEQVQKAYNDLVQKVRELADLESCLRQWIKGNLSRHRQGCEQEGEDCKENESGVCRSCFCRLAPLLMMPAMRLWKPMVMPTRSCPMTQSVQLMISSRFLHRYVSTGQLIQEPHCLDSLVHLICSRGCGTSNE